MTANPEDGITPPGTALPPQQHAPGPEGVRARRWRGLLLTIGTLGGLQVLGTLGYPVSNPGPVYLLAVAAAALDGGRLVGLASAAVALAYAAWFFATPNGFASYAPADLERLAILAVVSPAMALLVGTLRAGRTGGKGRQGSSGTARTSRRTCP